MRIDDDAIAAADLLEIVAYSILLENPAAFGYLMRVVDRITGRMGTVVPPQALSHAA